MRTCDILESCRILVRQPCLFRGKGKLWIALEFKQFLWNSDKCSCQKRPHTDCHSGDRYIDCGLTEEKT